MQHKIQVYSAQNNGLEGKIISVEVDISMGLHSFTVIGLPDKAVEEAKDRVSSAIKHSGFKSPKQQNYKIVVSLAPAHIKKEGSHFDLAIALSYLLAKKEINVENSSLFLGELSLHGDVREILGTLPLLLSAKNNGFKNVYIPIGNKKEAELVEGINIYPISNLKQLVSHLKKEEELQPLTPIKKIIGKELNTSINFEDIKGQETAKRAIMIAATGGHNIALYGPPGTGKTLLARAMQTTLPFLTKSEIIETTSLHSFRSPIKEPIIVPPFRSPHHSASVVSIIGGGTPIRPGEISLAHNGILFLDEFVEFDRRVIESLREPIEENFITITRSQGSIVYPSRSILVVALNPCPCGNYGSVKKACICNPSAIDRYRKKLSGPIIDRIDLWVRVDKIDVDELKVKKIKTDEMTIKRKELIKEARIRQEKRFKNYDFNRNSDVTAKWIDDLLPLSNDAQKTLTQATKTLELSPRVYHRIIKCSRTIADLKKSTEIENTHVLEALQYRQLPY